MIKNKITRNYSTDDSENIFSIICSFARSFDTSHKENNRIHLVSSLFLLEKNDFSNLIDYLKRGRVENSEQITYVFVVHPNDDIMKEIKVIDLNSVIVIECSLGILLKNLLFSDASDSLFNNLFGELNSERKDFNTISRQSIFIFNNQMWSNIVLNFKLNKVDVSGGSISKRHILQSVDYQLVIFLLNLFDYKDISEKVYNSYKNPILSSSIPLDFYNKFAMLDLSALKGKDTMFSSVLKDPSIYKKEVIWESYEKSSLEILKTNFVFAIDMLIYDITNGIKKELEQLNKKMSKYSSDLSSVRYKLFNLENIGNVSTKYMSNKEKKRFKKERTEILSKDISSDLSYLNSEISKLNNLIEITQEKVSSKELELNQFTENSKEYTISELINLQKKYLNINRDNYKYKKTRKVNNNEKGIDSYRGYHSLSKKSYSTSISKSNFNINSPVFVDLLRIFINSPLDNNTQMKIEQFLNDQGSILLRNILDQEADINYYKLNPIVFDCLLKSLNELELLISNYRNNLISKDIKINYNFVKSTIIRGVNNNILIYYLYNRLLRIIYNHNLINSNTIYTELAWELGKYLLYSYYVEQFKKESNKDTDSLSQFIQNKFKLISNSLSSDVNYSSLNTNIFNSSRPLGKYGDISLNKLCVKIKDNQWEVVLDKLSFTVHPLPLAMNFSGYNLILRSYMKYVHNRPYAPNLDKATRQLKVKVRNRQLAACVLIGAPLVLVAFKQAAIYIKEISSINIPLDSSTISNTDNNNNLNLINSSLFLLLSNINKKIPNWIKIFFKLLLFIILVIKLLGFSSILDIINNKEYLKIYTYVTCSLFICYQFLNIFMLYLFYKKKIKISEFLPEFVINWLTEFEIMCQSKENLKTFKTIFYKDILIYLLIIILISLIL